ncbi:hypothetical protein [Nocardia sp. NBC_00511]|uniref:hypothetical protein n=1 Tax=Nocardia sp. NBC_00511 TaxID=2903591 RepID=UPI0030DFB5DD
MSIHVIPPAPPKLPTRPIAVLTTLTAALIAAVVFAPHLLAAGRSESGFAHESGLRTGFRTAFQEYWTTGGPGYSPSLARIVDYWFRFHVVKAVVAALLLTVLITLSTVLWKAFRSTAPGILRAGSLLAGSTLTTLLALISLLMVMANIQGAIAPFSSLMPLLMDTPPDAPLTATLGQVRDSLAESPGPGGRTPPAAGVMIDDFTRYHVAMAVITATLALCFLTASVILWRRFARTASTDRPERRIQAAFGTLSLLIAAAAVVVAVANTTTAAHSAPGLLALFNGSW